MHCVFVTGVLYYYTKRNNMRDCVYIFRTKRHSRRVSRDEADSIANKFLRTHILQVELSREKRITL